MNLTIDLVPHMDAGDRNAWSGDQDERPLSELGWRQAVALANALSADAIDALYAGPALRCRESLQPLAERLGLPVNVLPELGEKHAWRRPEGWEAGPSEPAFAAGAMALAVDKLEALHPSGRVVACSHGHIIPAFIAYLVAAHGVSPAPPLEYRGQWYRLRFVDAHVGIERIEVTDFPR